MTNEDRINHIESIVDAMRKNSMDGTTISEFDKSRLSANVGIAIYDGLRINAEATENQTRASEKASEATAKAAKTLNCFTAVLAGATLLLAGTTAYQAYRETRHPDLLDTRPAQSELKANVDPRTRVAEDLSEKPEDVLYFEAMVDWSHKHSVDETPCWFVDKVVAHITDHQLAALMGMLVLPAPTDRWRRGTPYESKYTFCNPYADTPKNSGPAPHTRK
jgi:hypothetical protein